MTDIQSAAGSGPWPQTRVRFAEPSDLDALMHLCQELAKENAVAPMMGDLVRPMIEECVARKGGMIGVVGDGRRVEGALCLRFNHLWYSTECWWLEDKFNFVLPEYRASNNASDLLEWAMWWQRQLNIPLMLGVVSNERTRAKVRLYERKLGPMSGALFLVGARTGLGE